MGQNDAGARDDKTECVRYGFGERDVQADGTHAAWGLCHVE